MLAFLRRKWLPNATFEVTWVSFWTINDKSADSHKISSWFIEKFDLPKSLDGKVAAWYARESILSTRVWIDDSA